MAQGEKRAAVAVFGVKAKKLFCRPWPEKFCAANNRGKGLAKGNTKSQYVTYKIVLTIYNLKCLWYNTCKSNRKICNLLTLF